MKKRSKACRRDKAVRTEIRKTCKEASVLGRRDEARIQQWEKRGIRGSQIGNKGQNDGVRIGKRRVRKGNKRTCQRFGWLVEDGEVGKLNGLRRKG